jgi:hypothetical protein
VWRHPSFAAPTPSSSYTGARRWCEPWAPGVDGLSDRTTIIDKQQCDKSADIFKVLRKMADINITSASDSGATNFETAAKVLKNVLGVVVEGGAAIALLDGVAALRQLRGKQFDLVAWFRVETLVRWCLCATSTALFRAHRWSSLTQSCVCTVASLTHATLQLPSMQTRRAVHHVV